MIDDKVPPNKRLRRGAVIRVQTDDKDTRRIVQLPEAEVAFLAADPHDGAIRALVGGFDFNRNQFNHATQALAATGVRASSPSSTFRPLELGFTPASVINDEPISFPSSVTGSQSWEPKNYDGKYEGPMRMRTALAKSKNMVSIRLLQASGVRFVQDYVTRFGFEGQQAPAVPDHGAGRRARSRYQGDGHRLRGVRQRWLPHPALRRARDPGRQEARCWRAPNRSPPATTPGARSIHATPT